MAKHIWQTEYMKGQNRMYKQIEYTYEDNWVKYFTSVITLNISGINILITAKILSLDKQSDSTTCCLKETDLYTKTKMDLK